MTEPRPNQTIVGKIFKFLSRYRVPGLVTLAILGTVLMFASRLFPSLKSAFLDPALLPYLTFLIVVDLAIAYESQRSAASTVFVENQDQSMDQLIAAVPRCRNSQIDLLEYAGSTTLPLIRTIKRERVPMRLLVKHPETVLGLQQQRMITTLDTLYNSVFDNTDVFEIRCYRLPYSLRGRYLPGVLLELGWLTPDSKRQTAYGHGNPSSLVDLGKGKDAHLREFFQHTFDEYWNDAESEDGLRVLRRFQDRSPGGAPTMDATQDRLTAESSRIDGLPRLPSISSGGIPDKTR